ncbi:hypothetical protein RN001_002183 [Aquatica leii]|uniref:SWIM-type domain-containing protein n=1 Tax=Aquatica leii TaxID=1421715 RepID=A0AAN7PGS1_9COLE|nr:hypothetical protein RN001_002183 [Aquatica leii]
MSKKLLVCASNLKEPPHTIKIKLDSDTPKEWTCICTCKAGAGGKCKHILACFIFACRNDLEPLSCTDMEQKWGQTKTHTSKEGFVCYTFTTGRKMFPLVEFAEESGGGLSVIRSEGYTPRKKEVFWPSTKESKKFEKILLSENQTFDDKWKLYSIKRCLYESDDYKVIKKKLKFDSSEEDTASKFSRPPTISLDRQLRNVASQQQLEVLEPVAQCSIPISRSSTPQSSLSGLDSSIVENSTLTTCLALQKKINK